MEKILYVNACVRSESRTARLAEALLNRLDGEIEEVKLENEQIAPLTGKALAERTALLYAGRFDEPMFRYAVRFSQSDIIVIAAPYWDLSFPSSLKVYLEAINTVGITFRYAENGVPQSLCRAKKLFYVATAGGIVNEPNMGFTYVKALANTFYGISDVKYYKAEGLDIVGADIERIMCHAEADLTVCI